MAALIERCPTCGNPVHAQVPFIDRLEHAAERLYTKVWPPPAKPY